MSTQEMPFPGGPISEKVAKYITPGFRWKTPPLKKGELYQFTFRGICRKPARGWLSSAYYFDAVYKYEGPITPPKPHQTLCVNGECVSKLESWRELGPYVYSGLYTGCGEQIEITMYRWPYDVKGAIVLFIECLSDDHPIRIWRDQPKRDQARREAEEQQRREKEAVAQHRQKLLDEVELQRRNAHLHRNLLDPDHRSNLLSQK